VPIRACAELRTCDYVKLILEDEAKKYMVASRKMQLASKKTLADATNRQMSFLLMRIFALLPPRRVQEQRAKIRAYLSARIGEARLNKNGKRVARAKLLRRDHLILQARRRKAGMKGL